MTELARLLSAPTTPCFFPVQWVIVTDILDLFGKLVYERLVSKANEVCFSNVDMNRMFYHSTLLLHLSVFMYCA